MPGTIHVSVLEFVSLRSSTTQISIKVSMGKKEYQTKDKGDFSFPLSSLRDKLIVTLEDSQGNEVARTVVESRLVVEKDTWDDLFPLEGGGHVRMKLQFVLSEEDRHRIRIMRESALRKKHDEFLQSELGSPPHAASNSIASNVAASLQPNHEVSDSHTSLLESELIQLQAGLRSTTPSILSKHKKSDPQEKEVTHSVQKKTKTKPNDTDGTADISSTTPVSRKFDVHLEKLSQKWTIEEGPAQNPARPKEDAANDIEKQKTTVRASSKIRNMITAFESNVNQDFNQDMRPKVKPTLIKSQAGKTRMEVSSSEPTRLSGSVRNIIPLHIRKGEEQIDVQDKGMTADLKEKVKVMHQVKTEEGKRPEHVARASTSERASVSGRMLNNKGVYQSSNLFGKRRYSNDNVIKQKTRKGIQPKEVRLVNHQASSTEEPYSSERNGAWIFPDGGKRLCITASGKQIMNLMGGFFSEAKNQLGMLSSSAAENAEQVKEDGDSSQRCEEESTVENSTDAGTPRGPIGKVMRVVIMVGFATLVLFTRQKTR